MMLPSPDRTPARRHHTRPWLRAAALAAALAPVTGAALELTLTPFASGLERPVYLTHAGDARLFVVEQPGRVLTFDAAGNRTGEFLDIRDRVTDGGNEQGLLSIAFHPRFADTGRVFANYTGDDGDTVVAEYATDAGRRRALPDSERVLLRIAQPYPNHNGGQLKFGPDGYLYIGMGDGGSGGDPLNAGQDRGTLLGAMLRIDVDGARPYAVPDDNPFAGGGGRAEIWAYGLRNPWRFSFDRATGDMYIADVGQNAYEEINFQAGGARGGQNYGWRVLEAAHCYADEGCSATGMVAPVAQYSHGLGCSVTGGYVYRGTAVPALAGHYLFGDFCSGTVWSLQRTGETFRPATVLAGARRRIASFGEDRDGELYLLDLDGAIHRIGAR